MMNQDEILDQLQTGKISKEEASRLLAQLKSPPRGSMYCKVSAKGALSVYGLQRMPVTLYVEQWERLLAFSDEVRAFIKDHHPEFSRKEDKGKDASAEE